MLYNVPHIKTNAAIKALLGEYATVLSQLTELVSDVSPSMLIKTVDLKTSDTDCISIQSVLTHIVQSGYTYVIEIRKWLGEEVEYKQKVDHQSITEYDAALDAMFLYNVQLFKDYPNINIEMFDAKGKIKTRWGQLYDVEQLFEHAIVHIMRHRRQVEKFLEIIESKISL